VEILDVYGIVDGHEQVNVAGVSLGISPGSQFVFFFDMQALCYIGRTDNPFFSMNFQPLSPQAIDPPWCSWLRTSRFSCGSNMAVGRSIGTKQGRRAAESLFLSSLMTDLWRIICTI